MKNTVVALAPTILQKADQNDETAHLTGTVATIVRDLRPEKPLYVMWPNAIQKATAAFLAAFPGMAMFAVKTNPHPDVLNAMIRAGMNCFDAASLEEVALVRSLSSSARICFMHTVKSPEAIRKAYFDYGVRDFSLDTEEELHKILTATGYADDLSLFVRLALPKNAQAGIDFSSKFGASYDESVTLLRMARTHCQSLGLCFHIGTQNTDAQSYDKAIALAAHVIRYSGVPVDALDVGGGFPVPYGDEPVPGQFDLIQSIKDALQNHNLAHLEIFSEPGRVLVAEHGTLVTRVELRKHDLLYLNDGTYGGLFDAGPLLGQRFPVNAIRPEGNFTQEKADFRFAGPTCDSLDMMDGPFLLPMDIKTGDWIAISNAGAYSQSLRTNFNGFGSCDIVCLYP